MKFAVLIVPQAEADLRSIHEFILDREGFTRANGVLQDLKNAVQGLSEMPSRGKEPPELKPLGTTDYLQIIAKPYRIVYFVKGNDVHVLVVADGRRDFSDLLARRLRDQKD